MTIKLLIGAADNTVPITIQQRSSLAPADAFAPLWRRYMVVALDRMVQWSEAAVRRPVA